MRYVIAVAAVLMAGSAWASDRPLPDIDVDALCRSDASSTSDQMVRNAYVSKCINEQQYYYDYMKIEWDIISDEHKSYCMARVQANPKYFRYSLIEPCVHAMVTREEYEGRLKPAFQK
jgi:hypothetical protein